MATTTPENYLDRPLAPPPAGGDWLTVLEAFREVMQEIYESNLADCDHCTDPEDNSYYQGVVDGLKMALAAITTPKGK